MRTLDISKYKIVHDVPPVLSKADRVAIDTEWVGMDKKKLHRPTGVFACATFYFGTNEVYIVENPQDIAQALDNIEQAGWIFHNAKFDIFHLRRLVRIPMRMKMWDTQLVEQVRFSGLYDEFNLAACARRNLDLFMDKEVREEFSIQVGELTRSQIEYACIDTIVTYELFKKQREEIDADDERVWKDIELPFLWTLLSIGGITLDKERWTQIAVENETKARDIQSKYGQEVPKISAKTGKPLKSTTFEGINLSSPKQVKEKFAELGYKLEGTGEEFVASLVDKCEFAKDLLEYREVSKKASTYGVDYFEKYLEDDGKIYTDYFQIGAVTGRMSSRSPNLQNQPRDGGYRECYVAGDGMEIVVADWASQEPKFAAYITGDENLIDALNSKEKLYIRIARDALGIEVKKGEPAYNNMKSTILGLFYGMSAKGLAERINVPVEEAQHMIDSILRAYPKLGMWIRNSQSEFQSYVTSVYGRKIWMNPYTNSWTRACLNYPIQSSASDAMKLAAFKLLDWKTNDGHSVIRLFVHDEVVCELPSSEVNQFIPFLESTMIDAAESLHRGVKGGVEVGHGHAWSCKA